jgi:hypothetical protein
MRWWESHVDMARIGHLSPISNYGHKLICLMKNKRWTGFLWSLCHFVPCFFWDGLGDWERKMDWYPSDVRIEHSKFITSSLPSSWERKDAKLPAISKAWNHQRVAWYIPKTTRRTWVRSCLTTPQGFSCTQGTSRIQLLHSCWFFWRFSYNNRPSSADILYERPATNPC